MLREAVTITSASAGPGTYTSTILFSDASKAPFVRVGDTLEDRLGNLYQIDGWTTFPTDFATGGTIIVSFVTIDIPPATFGGFGNAAIFTPAQVDVRPVVQSAGLINIQTLNSGQNSLYDLTCSWFDAASAAGVTIGDQVMDGAGKVYTITVTNAGATTVTVEEFTKEGISPVLGGATLYSPTANLSLFQGSPVSDPARTFARNRDDFNIDTRITDIESQLSNSGGAAVQEVLENLSGGNIPQYVAVNTDLAGSITILDPSAEANSLAFKGITSEVINNFTSGEVVSQGRMENITTAFALRDPLWVSKSGALTNVAPEIGVNGFIAGDFIIYVGHVARNQATPTNKDFFLKPEIVGQL